MFFCSLFGLHTTQSIDINSREWDVCTRSTKVRWGRSHREKSGRYRIYLCAGGPYSKGGDIFRGVKPMNGELVFLTLVLVRIVIPISLLLSFGTWIERRNAANAED